MLSWSVLFNDALWQRLYNNGCECEIWSVTTRKIHRWRVCDSQVFVRIYGSQEMKVYFMLTFYSRLGSRDIAVWVVTGLLTGYPLNPGSIRDAVTALSFPQSNQTDSRVQSASYSIATGIAVFTHGPQGPGPRAANFRGRHIKKKIEIEIRYAERKAVHEREI